MKIKKIYGREILASGGLPSVEVKVELESGTIGIASVSYGASAGSKEAFVLFDEDTNRYSGKGMLKAVANVNEKIAPILEGEENLSLRQADEIMIRADGTENKQKFGANAILGVSMALARAYANEEKIELYEYLQKEYNFFTAAGISDYKKSKILWMPMPLGVFIEGGKHADNSTDLQEYILAVNKQQSPAKNIQMMEEIYGALKKILQEKGFSTNVGNEGAFAPSGIGNNELPLLFITEAIAKAGYKPKEDAGIYIDAAASEFYKDGAYHLSVENKILNAEKMIKMYIDWFEKYPIIALEDGLSEFDWENWPKLLAAAKDVMIVADDLTVTNKKLWQEALDKKAANAILIKLNQAGTVTETIDCCLLAREKNFPTIPSHRGGGETNDTFLVDLAVAAGSHWIKVGPTRGERVCKYNRLMEIEDQILK